MAKTGGPRPSETPHQGRAAQRLGGAAGDLRLDQRASCISPPSPAAPASPTTCEELDRVGREVPVLLDLKPAGNNFMEDFHAGGSLPALWRRLKDHLDLNAKTVNGETIGEIIARWPAYVDDKIIRPLDNPLVKSEAIAILTGNLAPRGAAIKLAVGDAGAVPARRAGAGVRLAGRPGEAHRRSESERHAADRDGAAQRRPDRRAGHAGSGRAADPEEARLEGPEGHGAALRRADERHRVRHRGAACVARGRGRRAAGAGARRRPDRARHQGPQARTSRSTTPNSPSAARRMEAAAEARARLSRGSTPSA